MKGENDTLAEGARRVRASRILAGFVIAGLLYALVVFFISPGRYRSTTVIEFLPDPFFLESQDDQFVTTEGAVLTAPETLKLLAISLDLPKLYRLDLDYSIITLGHTVKGTVVEGTNRFSIEVTHANPNQAQQIAREIPVAYASRKEGIRECLLEARIVNLENKMEEEEDLLVILRKKLRRLFEGVGVTFRDKRLLTREIYLEFFQALPQEAQSVKASEWIEFEETWEEYENAQVALTVVKNRYDMERETLAQKHDPVLVHEEASYSKSAIADYLWLDLLWGAGKGLFFGFLALGVRRLILPKKEEMVFLAMSRSPRPRKPDPADIW